VWGCVCDVCVCGGDASYGTNGTKAMAPNVLYKFKKYILGPKI
jgi:hypothetical protein